MPEAADARLTELIEAFADGTPVDWEAAESTASTEQERIVIRQLSRIGRAALKQRRSAGPATWSHLQLRQKVGEGAFGAVYRAHDPRLSRDVALKLLHEPMAANRARASAAIEEGRLLARVRHPNVVTVHGAESLNGEVGIWTEFIEGETLQAIVTKSGPLPADAVTAIGVDLCRALTAVHDAGLLHRDIKAQNVMRETGGRIVLMDFGTGRDLEPVGELTSDVSGTPLYLAPELFAGAEASAASDIYALGVLMFFLLTGRYPVTGRTVNDVREGHLADAAPSLGELKPGAPRALVLAVDRALDRDPVQRFASAREFERALLATQPTMTGRGASDEPANAAPSRARLGLVAVLTALVLAAGTTWWSLADQRAGTGQQTVPLPVPTSSAENQASNNPTPSPVVPSPTPAGATPSSPTSPATDAGEGRTVLPDLPDPKATISPDGRWLAFDKTGYLVLQDLRTGDVTPLGRLSSEDVAEWPAFSSDSRSLAYRWAPKSGAKWKLGIVDVPLVPGRAPRLFEEHPDNVSMVHDWSPDRQSVLVTLTADGRPARLAWVPTSGEALVTEKEFDPVTENILARARVSINGDIAYTRRLNGLTQHIHLRSKDGRDEAIVSDTARNFFPLWSPDGSRLFYTTNVSVSIDLWAIAIRDGRAEESSRALVRPNIGEGTAVALTADGSYYYRNVFAPVDQIFVATGLEPRLPTDKPPFTNVLVGFRPRWSPDGQSLAFLRRTPSRVDLMVNSLRNPTERVAFSDAAILPMFWLSATQLFAQPRITTGSRAPNRIDLLAQPAVATPIGEDLEIGVVRTSAAALSRDGKSLFAGARAENRPWDRIVAIDVATGAAKPVYPLPPELVIPGRVPVGSLDQIFGIALSPNGHELAVAMRMPDGAHLFVVGVDGTGYRHLWGPYWIDSTFDKVSWTTRGIYFGEAVTMTVNGSHRQTTSWRILRIAPEGGKALPVLFDINGSDFDAGFDVSRDDSRIALHPAPGVSQWFSPAAGQGNRLWKVNTNALQAARKR